MRDTDGAGAPDTTEPASQLLEAMIGTFPNERVTVGELLDRFEDRAFGLLLLLLALPMCIPNVPGISTIFGLLMIAPAIQMIVGQHKPWLPKRVRAWSFQRDHMVGAIQRATPHLRRVEKLIRPRWRFLAGMPFIALFGLQTLWLAFVLVLPIPAGNWPPGIATAVLALGMIQRDGVWMMMSVPVAVVATVIAGVMLVATMLFLRGVFDVAMGWWHAMGL